MIGSDLGQEQLSRCALRRSGNAKSVPPEPQLTTAGPPPLREVVLSFTQAPMVKSCSCKLAGLPIITEPFPLLLNASPTIPAANVMSPWIVPLLPP